MEREEDSNLQEKKAGVQTETPEGETETRRYASRGERLFYRKHGSKNLVRCRKKLKKRVYRVRALYLALFPFHDLCILRIPHCRLCLSCKFP